MMAIDGYGHALHLGQSSVDENTGLAGDLVPFLVQRFSSK